MKSNVHHPGDPATKSDLDRLEARLEGHLDKFETKMEQLVADQADVILTAVDELMDKKLDEKLDAVIMKLDGILKGVDDLKQENAAGAAQLRRHEDRISKLETALT